MGFTERFFAAETLEEKGDVLMEERRKRVFTNPDGYVALPVPVKQQSQAGIQTLRPMPPELKLVWVIGMPGLHGAPGSEERAAMQLPVPYEEVAEDLAFLLNEARAIRSQEQNPQGGTDGETGVNSGAGPACVDQAGK